MEPDAQPDTPSLADRSSVTISARISAVDQKEIVRLAVANDRTPSREVRRAIRFYIQHQISHEF